MDYNGLYGFSPFLWEIVYFSVQKDHFEILKVWAFCNNFLLRNSNLLLPLLRLSIDLMKLAQIWYTDGGPLMGIFFKKIYFQNGGINHSGQFLVFSVHQLWS